MSDPHNNAPRGDGRRTGKSSAFIAMIVGAIMLLALIVFLFVRGMGSQAIMTVPPATDPAPATDTGTAPSTDVDTTIIVEPDDGTTEFETEPAPATEPAPIAAPTLNRPGFTGGWFVQ
jgi:hypothetical protein